MLKVVIKKIHNVPATGSLPALMLIIWLLYLAQDSGQSK
jgi:hypothetical protein